MTKRSSSKRPLVSVSWQPSPEISHPQVVQNCWRWSFRRRESIAAYCTCSLRRSTLCLLKFSVATLLCRSDCWLGWKVCYWHTRKQVYRACIAVCTCGLYPHIRCACDTDAAFDHATDRRPALVKRLVQWLYTVSAVLCYACLPFHSKHTATQHLHLQLATRILFCTAMEKASHKCITSSCFTPAQRSSPIVRLQ